MDLFEISSGASGRMATDTYILNLGIPFVPPKRLVDLVLTECKISRRHFSQNWRGN